MQVAAAAATTTTATTTRTNTTSTTTFHQHRTHTRTRTRKHTSTSTEQIHTKPATTARESRQNYFSHNRLKRVCGQACWACTRALSRCRVRFFSIARAGVHEALLLGSDTTFLLGNEVSKRWEASNVLVTANMEVFLNLATLPF